MLVSDENAVPIPPESLRFMGESEQSYLEIGELLARQLYDHGLDADGRLLDVGSGYGRLAAGLMSTGYQGRYVGFDILPRHVRWCQRHLGKRPGYRFRHLDVHNARYNPRGTIASADTRFPAKSGSKTFCALFSVFTHFYADDIRRYLAEIERVLVPGGRAVTTWFLFDDARLPAVTSPRARFPLVHRLDDVTRYETDDDPLKAIGFEESFARRLVAEAGLRIVLVRRGNWAADEPDGQFQDLVLLEKPLPPPPSLATRVRRRLGRLRRGRG